MTPEELKSSILQLAMRGKLVEQRPEEGTGEELLSLIREEKARLVKEGKLKKEKALTEIAEDEIPFEIPETWKWLKFGEAFNIINGFTPLRTNSDFWESGTINWMTVDDINEQGMFLRSTKQHITEKAVKSKDRIVPTDSVFLCCTATIGKAAINLVPMISNQQFDALVKKEEWSKYLDSTFVYFYVTTLKQKLLQIAGVTTFPFVSVSKLEKLLFPLPPLEEQRRIVARIEELMPLVERYAQAYDRLRALNERFPADLEKSALQLAMRGKLVEQRPEEGTGEELLSLIREEKARLVKEGKLKKEKPLAEIHEDEVPFEIPETWRWIRLGELIEVVGGVSYDKKDVSKSGLRILRGGNIQEGKVVLAEDDVFLPFSYEEQIKKIAKGDILIVASTGSKTVIGKPGFVECELPDTSIGAFLRICRPISNSLSGYLKVIFSSELYRSSIRQSAQGTNINNVKEGQITGLAVPLPPLEEQKRIAARIEELMPLCRKLKGNY